MAGYLGLATPGTPVDGASPFGATEAVGLEVAGTCGPSLAHDLFQPLVAVDGEYAAAPGLPLGCRPSPEGRVVAGTDALIVRRAAAESTVAQAGRLQLETGLRSARLAADGAGRLGAEAWHDPRSACSRQRDSTGRRNWPSLRRKRLPRRGRLCR